MPRRYNKPQNSSSWKFHFLIVLVSRREKLRLEKIEKAKVKPKKKLNLGSLFNSNSKPQNSNEEKPDIVKKVF